MIQLQNSFAPMISDLSTLEKHLSSPLSNSDISVYREAIAAACVELERRFDDGVNARELVALRSDFGVKILKF